MPAMSSTSLAYQVERRLRELGDAAAVHEKARAEMLVADARQAVKADADIGQLRSLTAELQGVYPGPMASGPGAGPQSNGGGDQSPSGPADDDVIDAEFTSS